MQLKRCLAAIVLALMATMALPAHSQEINLDSVSLEDLLNVKTAVTSKKETSLRASSGIVTVISDEDIKDMGARDLIDVLNTVPGISFAADVEGVVSVGLRGLWVYTGQYLLLIDGIDFNELSYAGTQYGNEFPVDQIKRIEIIRGPGSAIYGGSAELAVISITSKKGADLKGVASEATLGRMEKGSLRTNLSVSGGGVTKSGWDYSASGYIGKANRGEGTYTGYDSGTPVAGSYDMKDADTLSPKYLNVGASNQNFNFRYIYSDYMIKTKAGYNFTGLDYKFSNEFIQNDVLVSYVFRPSKNLKITPQIEYIAQEPWQSLDGPLSQVALLAQWDIFQQRVKSNLNVQYDLNESTNILIGGEYIEDLTELRTVVYSGVPSALPNGKSSANINDRAAFIQGVTSVGPYNITAGVRYENPNFTNDATVPRFGVTRAEKDWHAKLLYAQSFRTSAPFVAAYYPGLRPEKAETSELEFGHTLGQGYLTGNIFDTVVKDPFVYSILGGDVYTNFPNNPIGTRGFELDYRQKQKWGQLDANYSYYETNQNDVPTPYAVPTNNKALIGMPQHKVVLNSWFNVGRKNLKLNPSVIYLGHKYGYEYSPNLGGMELKNQVDSYLVNLYLSRENILFSGLSGGVGVFNILNQSNDFVQAYGTPGANGQASPMPGPTRELVVKLDYKKQF